MNNDDMARKLRAAGWEKCMCGGWLKPSSRGRHYDAQEAWKELAQQRERGTVQTPVVGTEDEHG